MHFQTFMAAVALVVAGMTGQPTYVVTKLGEPVSQATKALNTGMCIALF